MKYALGDARVVTEGEDYWLAPTAVVVGDVHTGPQCQRLVECGRARRFRADHHRRELQHPGRFRPPRRFRPSPAHRQQRHRRPHGHAARLHHRRRFADRHRQHHSERRQDRQGLPDRCPFADSRGQGDPRRQPGHGIAGQGDQAADAGADQAHPQGAGRVHQGLAALQEGTGAAGRFGRSGFRRKNRGATFGMASASQGPIHPFPGAAAAEARPVDGHGLHHHEDPTARFQFQQFGRAPGHARDDRRTDVDQHVDLRLFAGFQIPHHALEDVQDAGPFRPVQAQGNVAGPDANPQLGCPSAGRRPESTAGCRRRQARSGRSAGRCRPRSPRPRRRSRSGR